MLVLIIQYMTLGGAILSFIASVLNFAYFADNADYLDYVTEHKANGVWAVMWLVLSIALAIVIAHIGLPHSQ